MTRRTREAHSFSGLLQMWGTVKYKGGLSFQEGSCAVTILV